MNDCELVTAERLAEQLVVAPTTVKAWARRGVIPSVRVSPKIISFDPAEVVQALRAHAAERTQKGPDNV